MQLNDVKFAALRGLGYTGSVNDMTLQWLQAGGATSKNINDAWLEYLAVVVPVEFRTGHRSDDWAHYLRTQGHTGALNDMELEFWTGQLPP